MKRRWYRAEDYSEWFRKQESPADIGKELLRNERAWRSWARRFAPSPQDWPDEQGKPFYMPVPSSYPTIVVWTRIHRSGLVACEFYWDYVYPSEFPASQKPRRKDAKK